jgi:outer membrane protein assembly factor BamB
VSVFDAETGKVIRTLAGTENTSEILFHNGLLVLSIATQDKTQVKSAPPLAILVVDPETGKIQWRSEPMPSLADLSERGKSNVLKQGRLMIAADKDRVVAATTDEIVGYALDSGKEVWRVARPGLPPKKSKKSEDPEKKEQAPRNLPSVGTHNIGMLVLDSGRVYFGQPQKAGKVSNLITIDQLQCLRGEGQTIGPRQRPGIGSTGRGHGTGREEARHKRCQLASSPPLLPQQGDREVCFDGQGGCGVPGH